MCVSGLTMVLAAEAPLTHTAGTPMPGNVESPVTNSPGIGVIGPSNVLRNVGPYEPRKRLLKRACV